MKRELIKDMGNQVICDQCNQDYTNSVKCGGFIFGSHAYCPDCAARSLENIKAYGEEKYIKAYCPDDMSFKDFVITYRGDDNKVTLITFDKGEDMFGIQDEYKGIKCRLCGADITGFKDEVSKKEFKITGTCQKCQDELFG